MKTTHLVSRLWEEVSVFGSIGMYITGMVLMYFHNQTIAIELLWKIIFAYCIVCFLRLLLFSERPQRRRHTGWIGKIDASSFPSMHALRVGIWCIYLAQNAIFVVPLALAVLWSRIKLQKHRLSDVTVGVGIGLLLGLL